MAQAAKDVGATTRRQVMEVLSGNLRPLQAMSAPVTPETPAPGGMNDYTPKPVHTVSQK